ncbi:toll-like receptor 7 [Venturia canescens]|uniref:toll-like receptor 7 n=1 Tax=Venturia canescens TaxID=32260 RepID=UPI001C9D2B50|nr:toll-like receptor 7 [Venturia canescens]
MSIISCAVDLMVLVANREYTQNSYVPKIENGILESVEVIGEPPDTLNLSGLDIESIAANAFVDLIHVKMTNLANNSLSSLPQSIFSNLHQLESLSLENNSIEFFEFQPFSGLSNLKHLNISNNPVKLLLEGCLHGLGKTTDISTRFTHEISELRTLVFENIKPQKPRSGTACPKVSTVTEGTPMAILCVEDRIVKKLKPLEDPISESHCKIVNGISVINSLRLSDSGISTFEAGWYRLNMDSIKELNLINNNIIYVTSELLNDLPKNIKTVLLGSNKIVRLVKGIICNEHSQFEFG